MSEPARSLIRSWDVLEARVALMPDAAEWLLRRQPGATFAEAYYFMLGVFYKVGPQMGHDLSVKRAETKRKAKNQARAQRRKARQGR